MVLKAPASLLPRIPAATVTETPRVPRCARPRAAAVYDSDRVHPESIDRWTRVEPDRAVPLDLARLPIAAGFAVVLAVSGLGWFPGVDLPRVVCVMGISAGSLLAVIVVRRRLVRARYLLPRRHMDRIAAHRAEVCFPDDIVGEESDLASVAAGISEDDTTRQRRRLNQQAGITLDSLRARADALRAYQIDIAELSELATRRAELNRLQRLSERPPSYMAVDHVRHELAIERIGRLDRDARHLASRLHPRERLPAPGRPEQILAPPDH